ncbi:MAG: hypothetical protein ACKVX7_13825 [Planctomycetota bacterium]
MNQEAGDNGLESDSARDVSQLKFDKLATAGPSAVPNACGACGNELLREYYTINDRWVCAPCADQLQLELSSDFGLARFCKALVFGLIGGALGSGIYYAVKALTGYEIGLVAIVVGFIVGTLVKKGSGGRGGWVYQLLAIFLTYVAIVSTYIPFVVRELRGEFDSTSYHVRLEQVGRDRAALERALSDALQCDAEQAREVAEQLGVIRSGMTRAEAEEFAERLSVTGATAIAEKTKTSSASADFVTVIAAWLLLLAFAFALPFLAGFDNIIGWIIIGVALYEAWRLTAKAPLRIAGPFQVGANAARPGSA